MYKVIIFGSRDFKDKELLFERCDFYLSTVVGPIEVVSGGQKSYDKATDTYYGADFATGDKGGDAISLFAYLNGLQQGQAARALAQRLGVAA